MLAKKYPNLKEAHYRKVMHVGDEFVVKMTELWKDLRVVDLCNGVVMQRVATRTDT